jgi:hypothetical protein
MQIPELWSKSLEKQPDVKELIQQLLFQIKKDFSFFGVEINFLDDTSDSYQLLFNQLKQFLNNNFSHQVDRLYPVLYRIDVLEKDIKNAINNQLSYDFMGAIAELVIIKELQKVIIRQYYKAKD